MLLEPDDPLAPVYFDINTMTIVLNNGDTVPVTDMFDAMGDECLDPFEAMTLLAGRDDVGWWTVPLEGPDDAMAVH